MSKYADLERFRDKSLDEVLEAIASPTRLEILKQLYKHDMNYTELIRSVGMSRQKDAGKFSYHLKKLIVSGLVKVNEKTKLYELSPLGRVVLEMTDEMKRKLATSDIMIVRRSDCEMEPFDKSKIANSLIKETGMPTKLAHRIATIVEEKLIDLKIEYLSAPLIRELVNSILIDQGLESYRHKLTRVGMPLYDVRNVIKEAPKHGRAISVIKSAYGSVIKEYTLLENLPRSVADAYMSGLIDLYSLETWVTSFYCKAYHKDYLKSVKDSDFSGEIIKKILADLFSVCREFILHAVCENFSSKREISHFASMLARFSSINIFDGLRFVVDLRGHQDVLEEFYRVASRDARNITLVSEIDTLFSKSQSELFKGIAYVLYSYIPDSEVVSSDGFRVSLGNGGAICSIASVNLPRLALESNGDMDKFLDNLKRALNLVFSAFSRKVNTLEELYEKSGAAYQFIVSACGAFEAAKFMSGAQDLNGIVDVLVKILDGFTRYAFKSSKKRFRVKVSNLCPQPFSRRMMRLDMNRYGIKTVSRLLLNQSSQNVGYSTQLIPTELEVDVEERVRLESKIARLVNGGYLLTLQRSADSRGLDEVLGLIKKYLWQEGISIKLT